MKILIVLMFSFFLLCQFGIKFFVEKNGFVVLDFFKWGLVDVYGFYLGIFVLFSVNGRGMLEKVIYDNNKKVNYW